MALEALCQLRLRHPQYGIPSVFVIADPISELRRFLEHLEAGTLDEYRRMQPKVVRFPTPAEPGRTGS